MGMIFSYLPLFGFMPKTKETEKLIRLRRIHEDEVRARSITKVFRPGTVGYSDFYFPGEDITLVVIKQPGSNANRIEPVFIKDINLPIRVIAVEARPFGELTSTTLIGSGFDSLREVALELALVYNKKSPILRMISLSLALSTNIWRQILSRLHN